MPMRWYQHNSHGAYPATSLKYKLPAMVAVDTAATAPKATSSTVAIHADAHAMRAANTNATAVTTATANTTRANTAEKICTVSVFTSPFLPLLGTNGSFGGRIER